MKEVERRIAKLCDLEVRAAGETEPAKLIGYAAKFNVRSDDLGGWVEEIAPGAFDKALQAGADVIALKNHDPNLPLARSGSGLKLSTDTIGLRAEIDLPPTQAGRDLETEVGLGIIRGMSFGFRVAPGGALWDLDSDPVVRTVNEIGELFDVSVVTYPAYPQTEVALRSLEEARAAAPSKDAPSPVTPSKLERLERVGRLAKGIFE